MTLPDSLYLEHFFLPCCPGIPLYHSTPLVLNNWSLGWWRCGGVEGLGRTLEVGGSQAGAEGRQEKGWQLRQVSAPSSFTLSSRAEVEAAPRHQLWDPHQHTGGVGAVSKRYPGPQGLCPVQCERWPGIPQVWLAQPLGRGCLGYLHALPSSLHPPVE